MPALSEYSNVYNTAFNILDKKGFNLWYDESTDMFCAEKNGWDFMSDSPCGLLGLISIYEYVNPRTYEEYWWRVNDKDLSHDLGVIKPSYKSVSQK